MVNGDVGVVDGNEIANVSQEACNNPDGYQCWFHMASNEEAF